MEITLQTTVATCQFVVLVFVKVKMQLVYNRELRVRFLVNSVSPRRHFVETIHSGQLATFSKTLRSANVQPRVRWQALAATSGQLETWSAQVSRLIFWPVNVLLHSTTNQAVSSLFDTLSPHMTILYHQRLQMWIIAISMNYLARDFWTLCLLANKMSSTSCGINSFQLHRGNRKP